MSVALTHTRDLEPLIPFKALAPLLEHANECKVPERLLFAELDHTLMTTRRPNDKVSWSEATIFLENFQAVCNYDALYEQFYETFAKIPSYKIIQSFVGLFTSPITLYKGLVNWFGPSMWPNTSASLTLLDEPGAALITIDLKPGFRGCKTYFDMCSVLFSSAPQLIGYPNAIMDAVTTPNRGVYRIKMAKSRTVVSRAKHLFSGDAVIAELTDQHNDLLMANEELKSLNTELRNQRAAYVRAVRGASDGLWEIDLDSGRLTTTPRWGELTHIDHLGSTLDAWLENTHPEDRAALRDAIDQRDVRLEVRARDGDGWRWLEARAERVEDAEGSFLAGSIRDITDRRRATSDMRSIVEISPNPMCILRQGSLLYANQAAYSLLGSPSDIEATTRSPHIQHVIDEQLSCSETADRDEIEWLLPNYDSIPVSILTTSCSFQGEPAIMLSIRDLSAEREITAHMIQMDRLVSIGTLAAGIGHEINNPLTYVYGNIDLLRTELSEALEAFARESSAPHDMRAMLGDSIEVLSEMSNGAERIRDIVQDLRIFSRLREENRLERFDVTEVVASSINVTFSEIRHRARLVKDFHQAPRALFDRARLAQILTNLLINAAHAIDPDSSRDDNTIRVSVRASPGGDVLITISDTGCGIPQENIERIFDPFFTTKPEGTGTGLGLSICQSLARSMGGELWVDSAEGAGTTITVRIPSGETHLDSHHSEQELELVEDRVTLLVIDDEHAICEMLSRGLSDTHHVITFNDHEAALAAMLDGLDFDIALVDVTSPTLSGIDLLDRASTTTPDIRARASFITGGVSSSSDSDRMRRANIPVIHKPFSLRAIRQHIQQRLLALQDVDPA